MRNCFHSPNRVLSYSFARSFRIKAFSNGNVYLPLYFKNSNVHILVQEVSQLWRALSLTVQSCWFNMNKLWIKTENHFLSNSGWRYGRAEKRHSERREVVSMTSMLRCSTLTGRSSERNPNSDHITSVKWAPVEGLVSPLRQMRLKGRPSLAPTIHRLERFAFERAAVFRLKR